MFRKCSVNKNVGNIATSRRQNADGTLTEQKVHVPATSALRSVRQRRRDFSVTPSGR
jgi:hypothetical protein